MNRFPTLMRREWMQHRFGWSLAVLLPLALGALLLAFGRVQVESDTVARAGADLPVLLALAAMAGGCVLLFLVLGIASLVNVAGLARRDHADRSVEFWLSLPVGHSSSLAAPLLVHLLLVPALALVLGAVGGGIVSAVLVARVAGFGEWLTLPWGQLLPAVATGVLRLLAGLPLALLWLSPLVMLVLLLTAWFRRWGWVILAVGLGLGSVVLERIFGAPLLADTLAALLNNAATSMVNGGIGNRDIPDGRGGLDALRALPAWAWRDWLGALRELASPLLAGGLLFAAGCFALLVDWRRRGASVGG